MGKTLLTTDEIGSVQRNDFDITTTSQAVITKVIAGTGITITQTGIDAGTGDVTINSTGGALSLSPIGTTPNANAATIAGSVLNLEPASASFGGIITTGAQTIAGVKTFNDSITSVGQILSGTDASGIKLKNVSTYNGIWFDQVTPSLINYNFLYDYSTQKTVLSGPMGVAIRVANAYNDSVVYNATTTPGVTGYTLIVGQIEGAPIQALAKLHVKGSIYSEANSIFLGALMPNNLAGTTGQILQSNGAGVSPTWVTISAGSGITRSINNIAVNTTAGATSLIDYVYLCTSTITVTLPTSVGNTNIYTIKNKGTGVITIATTLSQTIDSTTTITINPDGSVDLISDGSNWFVI